MWFRHMVAIYPLYSVSKRYKIVKVTAFTVKRAVMKARKKYPLPNVVYLYLGRVKKWKEC